MASPKILHNAYTDAPQQHPNLILGSLQLLFWLFFRPAAWRNHLKRIDSTLDTDISLITFIGQGRWRNLALWRLFIQGYIILPILINLLLGLVLWALGTPTATIFISVPFGLAVGLVVGLAFGLAVGLAFVLAFCLTFLLAFAWTFGLVFVLAFGLAFGLTFGLAFGWTFGWAVGWAVSLVAGLTFGLAVGLAFGLAVGLVGGLAVGLTFGLAVGLGLTIHSWRPFLSFPFLTVWNYRLFRLDKIRNAKSPCLFRYHSAFWDEWQRLHLPGLDEYLLFVIEHNPVEGKAALEYLTTSHQRWAVQAVQIELDARSLENCGDVDAIRQVHHRLANGELESPVRTLLNIFSRISEDVNAALNQASTYNKRLALSPIIDRLDVNLQEFIRSSDKYTIRFRPIAKSWREIIADYAEELAKATELRQEIDSPYIIGVPLTQEQEIFTGRNDIGTRIEQLLLDLRRPPLLLYGQRRMGKTSLLNNLGKLLPNTIIPIFVDLQGAPSSASNHAGFLYNLTREMVKSAKQQDVTLPPLTRDALNSDPFTSFDEWLDTVEQVLKENTALLMLDEFEVLDSAITKGRFDEQDILGMLRHLIQHRPRFKVLLAGSHTIEEYQRWASYLINVQVVHISYLKEAEARQLIERPVKDFTLRYEPDAVERVLQLTRCHPFLIQLLCAEIIALKNEQDPSVRRLATLTDVEAAIPEAFKGGGFFFADIQNNQIDDHGRAILGFIAAQGEGAMVNIQAISQQFPNADITLKLLLQRELIEEVGQDYCFGVELIRRWFTL
ncbi:ATP-binding protein [Calothrix sp. FACHB-156]|nr:ATP-binding protein [Calothrix sp. FACHB-156]